MRGTALHCSRFGAVVRLEDGRLALLPADGPGMSAVRRAMSGGRRPQLPFVIEEDMGRHVRVGLAERPADARADDEDGDVRPELIGGGRGSYGFEQKIIDYLRESAQRDPKAAAALAARSEGREQRLLRFEQRARTRFADEKPPRRTKR